MINVPDNVRFHLNCLGFLPKDVRVEDCLSGKYKILLTKAMYGLVDAPLLWNLSFKAHLVLHMGAWVSHLDDNFYFFRDPETQVCLGNLSTHVDDTGVTGSQESLDFWRTSIEEKFGKVTRQTLPFLHVGVQYSRLDDGSLFMCQREYCKNIKPIVFKRGRNPKETLSPEEVTSLRSAIGALLYLCWTRPDVHADVTIVSQKVTKATVAELKFVNALIQRAQATAHLGLHYHRLTPPLRIMAISDASHASSSTSYAIEGTMVLMVEDRVSNLTAGIVNAKVLNSRCHVFWANSMKAKRISHSTSHAESLGMYDVSLQAEQLAMRLTELTSPEQLDLKDLIRIEKAGNYDLPIDVLCDCNDVLELVTGKKGVPQDKSRRLIIFFPEGTSTYGSIWFSHSYPHTGYGVQLSHQTCSM